MDLHRWHIRTRLYAFAIRFSAAFVYYSGLVTLARWWTQRSGRYVIILNYHRASNGDLRSHFLYLRRHYRVLPLEQALEELHAPAHGDTQSRDRRTRLVLTFDDGYHDHYTHAARLATELMTPITIFLIPGYIESGRRFWWHEGDLLVRQAQVDTVTVDAQTFQLDRLDERRSLARLVAQRARFARSVAEREEFIVRLRQRLAIPPAAAAPADDDPTRPLTWAEAQRMEEAGWVSFGAHSVNHPVLSYLSDPAEIKREVSECRTALEERLRSPVRTFAYPIGKVEHIGDQALQAVREAGYTWAVSTIPGHNAAHGDPHLLRRTYADASEHWRVVAARAAGVWPPPEGVRGMRIHLPLIGAFRSSALPRPKSGEPVTGGRKGSSHV